MFANYPGKSMYFFFLIEDKKTADIEGDFAADAVKVVFKFGKMSKVTYFSITGKGMFEIEGLSKWPSSTVIFLYFF